MKLAAWLVSLALAALPGTAWAPQAPAPAGFQPVYKVISRPPETNEPYLRAWWAYRDAAVGVAYAVVPRKVPMHVHLDADHVVTVVEGSARVTMGGAVAAMGPGDVLAIPRGMAHEIARAGQGRLLMIDVSTPPGDMARTFWIESPSLAPPAAPAPPPPRRPAAPPTSPAAKLAR